MSLHELQQELLAVKRELAQSEKQVLSLEAALVARPRLPPNASNTEKDHIIEEQARSIRELEMRVSNYENNLGKPLRTVRGDIEREWSAKLENEVRLKEEKEAWVELLIQQIEKERQASSIVVRQITPCDLMP
jgi:centromeric protein E